MNDEVIANFTDEERATPLSELVYKYKKENDQLKKDSEYKTVCIRKGNDLEFELKREIEQLKRINTLLEESNNFYAYKDNWDYGTIDIEDTVLERGGKLARETAKQIEKIRSE